MANRSGRSWLFAGIVGAALGIYLMSSMDNIPMQRRMKTMRRKWKRGINNSYEAGKNMVSNRIEAMRR